MTKPKPKLASENGPPTKLSANIICISGNNQKRGEATGMDALGWRLRNTYDSNDVRTHIYPWNGDIAGLARFIAAHSKPHPECVNIGLFYSWGWGRGGYRLGHKLLKEGHWLKHAIIIDGVPRPLSRMPGDLFWGSVFICTAALTFFKAWPNKVPPNVDHVVSCRQTNDWPQGRKFKMQNPTTTHKEWRVFGKSAPHVRHRTIDDLTAVHDYADAHVGGILKTHGLV